MIGIADERRGQTLLPCGDFFLVLWPRRIDVRISPSSIRPELRRPNRSWRVDETYLKVAGNWAYLYRAVDSAGATIEFMLSHDRDLAAAKMFLRLALCGVS